jgi:hypothetical protein
MPCTTLHSQVNVTYGQDLEARRMLLKHTQHQFKFVAQGEALSRVTACGGTLRLGLLKTNPAGMTQLVLDAFETPSKSSDGYVAADGSLVVPYTANRIVMVRFRKPLSKGWYNFRIMAGEMFWDQSEFMLKTKRSNGPAAAGGKRQAYTTLHYQDEHHTTADDGAMGIGTAPVSPPMECSSGSFEAWRPSQVEVCLSTCDMDVAPSPPTPDALHELRRIFQMDRRTPVGSEDARTLLFIQTKVSACLERYAGGGRGDHRSRVGASTSPHFQALSRADSEVTVRGSLGHACVSADPVETQTASAKRATSPLQNRISHEAQQRKRIKTNDGVGGGESALELDAKLLADFAGCQSKACGEWSASVA